MGFRLCKDDHISVLKIVLVYALFGGMWIYFSDTALAWLHLSPELILNISIYKGLLFIIFTSLLLYALIVRHVLQTAKAKRQTEASEQKFSRAFHNSPVQMTLCSFPDGAFLNVNREFEELTGFIHEETLGKTALELGLIGPEDWSLLLGEMRIRESCSALELKQRTKDGKTLNCVYYAEKITVDEQPVMLSIVLDVTEHRRLENQLRQALKMESIGRLAGGVAHDFNNKLSVILGYAEMSKLELQEGSRLWQNLEEISRAAIHSRDITRQLLVFSRQDIVAPKPQNLNVAIQESQRTLGHLIGEDIHLSFFPGDNLWLVNIDPAQVDQIIMNLAVNARDAMPSGGSLSISTRNAHVAAGSKPNVVDAKPGDYVCLFFSDSGIGMDSDTQRNIFEPFFTTKDVGKGTGLGLSTVYGIVSQNGGFIEVESQLGHGATFGVYLPRLNQEQIFENVNELSGIVGAGTVLLVEDEEPVRNMIAMMLERIGYHVVIAGSSQEAILICGDKELHLDIVLSDVVMPGCSGKEMIERIEQLQPGVKVLYMSGYSSEIISQKGILEGELNFIHKPFDIGTLNNAIKSLLSKD